MENFLAVSSQVWVLFMLVAAGAACRLSRLADDATVKGMVNILVVLVTPSLIIDVFQRPFDGAMLRQLAAAFAVSTVAHCVAIAAASALFRGGDSPRRPVLRLSAVFSNAGFMGIPLEYAILGERGVFFGIVYVVVFNVAMWSWGLWQMNGAESDSGGSAARRSALAALRSPFLLNPGTVGLAIGMGLFVSRTTLPQMLAQPVAMMAALNTPMAMLAIGYYLAGANLRGVARTKAAYAAAGMRLVAFPLAMLAALYPLRHWLDRDMMLSMVVAASAPVAAMVAMFAAKFGRDVDLSVGLVSATTLLSIVTMPPIIALAMSVL